MGRSRRRERCFLTHAQPQSYLFHDLERKGKVAEKDVDAKESDEREIPELAVQWPCAILARDGSVSRVSRVLATRRGQGGRTRSRRRFYLRHGL